MTWHIALDLSQCRLGTIDVPILKLNQAIKVVSNKQRRCQAENFRDLFSGRRESSIC